jgi:hypothetical protein
MRPKLKKLIFIIPLAILGMALFMAIGGEVVRLLWNWLLPPLFGWRELTFWQALGMLALCRILFGGFGMHGSGRSRSRTPEERERIRQAMRKRFGFGPAPVETKAQ